MPKLEVRRGIEINRSPAEVFAIVSDLSRWRPWNPWLVTEPEATVTVSPDCKSYVWSGKRTGEGQMKVAAERSPTRVEIELTFLKPYKSQARVGFDLEALDRDEGDAACRVTWWMDSSLPFFLFFMKKTMLSMLSMDYDRGLAMLKDYVETGRVPSTLELVGEESYPGCHYVGIRRTVNLDELGSAMSADLASLRAWAEEHQVPQADGALGIYHAWRLGRGEADITSALSVESVPAGLPPSFVSGTVPPLRTYRLRHLGPYRFLGNAWSTGMAMSRAKEFRPTKRHPPFERYVTEPGSSPDIADSPVVDLHFPLA